MQLSTRLGLGSREMVGHIGVFCCPYHGEPGELTWDLGKLWTIQTTGSEAGM